MDFRNSESWNHARLAVCAVLQFTESLSGRSAYTLLARKIDQLSISMLDSMARGYEGSGDRNLLMKAANTIDQLEQELAKTRGDGLLNDADSALLKESLDAVRESLLHV